MKILKDLFLMILVILTPIKAALITVGVLVIMDLFLGLAAAKKRKEPITSSGLRRTVSKLLVYEMAIILGFITETYLAGSIVPISKIISGLIGITELKSILESLDEVNGASIFDSLIKKLGSKNDV